MPKRDVKADVHSFSECPWLFFLAGHNAYQDEPERYMAEVRAFLAGKPLPESPNTNTRIPNG